MTADCWLQLFNCEILGLSLPKCSILTVLTVHQEKARHFQTQIVLEKMIIVL